MEAETRTRIVDSRCRLSLEAQTLFAGTVADISRIKTGVKLT